MYKLTYLIIMQFELIKKVNDLDSWFKDAEASIFENILIDSSF
jgi:hypothetical protein